MSSSRAEHMYRLKSIYQTRYRYIVFHLDMLSHSTWTLLQPPQGHRIYGLVIEIWALFVSYRVNVMILRSIRRNGNGFGGETPRGAVAEIRAI